MKILKQSKHVDLNFENSPSSEMVTMIYKALYQLNDVVIGIIFLIGSFLFFNNDTMFTGTVFFVVGSIQMTARPLIAFAHDLHLAYKNKQRRK